MWMKRGVIWGVLAGLMPLSVYADAALQVPGKTIWERMRWITEHLLPVPKPVWITLCILGVLILGMVIYYRVGEEKKSHGKKN